MSEMNEAYRQGLRDGIDTVIKTISDNITITPLYIKIGCQHHTKKAWFNFTDEQIKNMGGKAR